MSKRTVLVVDDHIINRKILGKILESEYEVMYACDGREALECITTHLDTIAAVLLDIVMPVMDGYKVLDRMRQDPELSKIPVIVSSQREGEDDEINALKLGAQDYIAKPYKADIIKHRLQNIIRLRENAAIINRTERDELTGLYNKQYFMQKVRELLRNDPKQQYDMIFVGIEHFKLVNEIFGMKKGDDVLRHVGEVLREVCSMTGISSRFAGDQFYGILPHCDHYSNDMIRPWIEQINHFPIDMDIKIHTGIYAIQNQKLQISAMCDRAKMAAQQNRGKYEDFFYMYDDSLRDKLLEEQFITSNMYQALEQKQFQVYYQPKYDLYTEKIVGAEALVRWIHPEKGLISPGNFIPLFERNGFITRLDEYVWEVVCSDIRGWINQGLQNISISVNVSRADIYNSKLIEILNGLIQKYEIPMPYFHLEITESAYTENPKQIIAVVEKLRGTGYIIEMDDFGSGYSSLNMLAEMPVDVLKLDMGFIQSETNKSSGKGILSFVISLAKWLDLAVVAEGVETKEQLRALRTMDCNYVQGFYFAKPMEKTAFEKLIRDTGTLEMICTSQNVGNISCNQKEEIIYHKSDKVMLIVDDIELNRALLASCMKDQYIVEERENGKTAWEYLDKYYENVQIIMLDLLMPVMDGFQLLAKIREDKRMKDIPVIITSQGDTDSELRALKMRADDFISKPYNTDIVKHRVANVVASYQIKMMKKGYKIEL